MWHFGEPLPPWVSRIIWMAPYSLNKCTVHVLNFKINHKLAPRLLLLFFSVDKRFSENLKNSFLQCWQKTSNSLSKRNLIHTRLKLSVIFKDNVFNLIWSHLWKGLIDFSFQNRRYYECIRTNLNVGIFSRVSTIIFCIIILWTIIDFIFNLRFRILVSCRWPVRT